MPALISKRIRAGTELTAAAVTQTFNYATLLPAKSIILSAWTDVTTLISGGTISAATVKVGTAGTTNLILDAQNVFTGQATGVRQDQPGAAFTGAPTYFKTATQLQTLITLTGDNAVNAAAGDLTTNVVYVQVG
jgi:hypothetical protein